MIRRTSLAELEPKAVSEAFNRVYADYAVPFQVDESWAVHHFKAMDIVAADSLLWLDDDGVAALACLGVRGDRGWVGGLGVAPSHRGKGLGGAILQALLEVCRRLGLRELSLEVLCNNPRAIKLYEQAGFVRQRELRILRWETPLPLPIGPVEAGDALALLEERHRLTAVPPAWSREAATLRRTPGIYGMSLGNPIQGYVLCGASREEVTLVDLAVTEAAGVAALIAPLVALYPNRPMRIVNEPEESPVGPALEDLGWRETLRQLEMKASCGGWPPVSTS